MIRRLAMTLCAAVTAAIAVPAAGAFDGPPDALDRYKSNHADIDTTLALGGSPDAIDRYQQANAALTTPSTQGSPDAVDRYRVANEPVLSTELHGSPDAIDRFRTHEASASSTLALGGSPDAIDRYRTANEPVLTTPPIQGSPDAIDRYAGRVVVTVPGESGFSWDDFGIGAAAMLGMVLVLAGVAFGLLAARHRSDRLRTS